MADIKRVIRATVDLNDPIQKTILRDLFMTESKNAHEFRVKLVRGDDPVPLDDVIVSGFFMRYKDSVSIVLDGSVQDGEVVVVLPSECYEMRTVFSITIAVENGETRTPVFVGEGQLAANRSDAVYDPVGVVPSLQDILSQYELMQSANEESAAAAQDARSAAISANLATDTALYAASAIDGMTVSAYTSSYAAVSVSTIEGVKHIRFGLPKGESGKSFTVLGTYASLDDLMDEHLVGAQGDVYNVGSDGSYVMYMWDDGANSWLSLGVPSGIQGKQGEPGYSPVRGVDYWTTEDQSAIVSDVLALLPNASGVSF